MNATSIQISCLNGHVCTIDLSEEDLSWEVVDSDEREMGTETLHEAILEWSCDECQESIVITLHVWEYPEGFCNMDEIEVDGGELIQSCDLGQFVISWEE